MWVNIKIIQKNQNANEIFFVIKNKFNFKLNNGEKTHKVIKVKTCFKANKALIQMC